MHHTVVISDIHLCEVEPTAGEWMRYRQRSCLPDAEIGRMLKALCDRVSGESLTLVFGGDVFDFDAPRVVGGTSEFHDLPRTADHCVPALAAMLDDHPLFIDAIADVLKAGHEVVFVSGNHDVQLTLPEVRALLTSRLVDATVRGRSTTVSDRAAVQGRIHFRAWFHLTNDKILIEHGHQYDMYCAYRYPMAPYVEGRREIVPTIGSIGTRVLVSRLGYFNPHVDRSFNMTKAGYLKHWARYYLLTRRSIAWIWLFGMTNIMTKVLRARQRPERSRARQNIVACMRETGAGLWATARHARLQMPPADSPWSIARDLWVDRVFVMLGAFAVGVSMLLMRGPVTKLFGALVPMLMFGVYHRMAPRPRLAESWEQVTRVMQKIARVHGARAVVFGHTHHPFGEWNGEVFTGNSGSWSAAVSGTTGELLVNERPLIWLSSSEDGELRGGLFAWTNGRIESRQVRSDGGFVCAVGRNEPRQDDAGDSSSKRDQEEHREADAGS